MCSLISAGAKWPFFPAAENGAVPCNGATEELERDRLEMAAELAHRGPTQASKARWWRDGAGCDGALEMMGVFVGETIHF